MALQKKRSGSNGCRAKAGLIVPIEEDHAAS